MGRERVKANRVEYDGIWFDSELEWKTYLALLNAFDKDKIEVHHPLFLAEKNEHFAEWNWKVDFFIPQMNLYVETKGFKTDAWREKLHAISVVRPDVLTRLLVVGAKDGVYITKKIKTISIPQLNGLFRTIAIARSQARLRETIPK